MKIWDDVAGQDSAWYLDPLVAKQKQDVMLQFLLEWMPPGARRGLKTDVFEEAYEKDPLLPGLSRDAMSWIGMDVSFGMVRRAAATPVAGVSYIAADVRCIPLPARCLDVVVSTSTLDHFGSRAEFDGAIGELARVLRPGGRLLITVDNPANPLYPLLRRMCRWGPYPLGYTPSLATLKQTLAEAGLEVHGTCALIHNPRMISTGLFRALRGLLQSHADRPIGWLLTLFAAFGRLPTRGLTACFLGACAEKGQSVLASSQMPSLSETQHETVWLAKQS